MSVQGPRLPHPEAAVSSPFSAGLWAREKTTLWQNPRSPI